MEGGAEGTGVEPPGLYTEDGTRLTLDVQAWFGQVRPEEQSVLDHSSGPALDVGCGPGRLTLALARRGVAALGVDISPAAVKAARRRGAPAIQRSVFGAVPGPGTWGSALLLDGNTGIGGDPLALLRRVRELLRPEGRALVELSPPGVPTRAVRVRIERGVVAGPWFPWAVLGVDGVHTLASLAGFRRVRVWRRNDRWFARLDTL